MLAEIMDMPRGETLAQNYLRRAKMGDKQAWRKLAEHMVKVYGPVRGGSTSPVMTQQQLNDLNAAQRATVIANSVERVQQIFSTTIATPTAGNNVVNINPKNTGLWKRFVIVVSGTLNNTDGTNASTATAFGLANLLSNVQFTDLANFVRVNTDGIHLTALKQVKHKTTDPASAPVTTAQSDAQLGGQFVASGSAPNFPVIAYPLPASGVSAAFRAVFELPIVYSDNDLRGGIFANVINAQAQISLTINPTPCSTGADVTNAVWGGGAGNISNVTIQVYQVYLDQLPAGKNGTILPVLDMSTIYELKKTAFSGMVQGADFPFPYTNFRDFLSTFVVFNSTGATAGLKNGVDVNYFSLQSANFVNIFQIDPLLSAKITRDVIGSDLPLGTYYFSFRKRPVSTYQYGNMQLILNPASVTAGSCYANVYWEDFGQQNTLTTAGSLGAA